MNSLVSWTAYDRKALSGILENANIQVQYIDAAQRTRNCVVWHTYKLHGLHDALFSEKTETEIINGAVAGIYADHMIIPKHECIYCPNPIETIEKIKTRNRLDLLQMVRVCQMLWEV